MNADMKEKLSKYMQTDGLYDIWAIRAEYPGDNLKAFRSLFWADDESMEGQDNTDDGMSDEWRAAADHNEALLNQREAEEKIIQDAILSADEINWSAAEKAGMIEYGDEDGEGRPMKVYLKHEFDQRRRELRSGKPATDNPLFNTDTPEENTKY